MPKNLMKSTLAERMAKVSSSPFNCYVSMMWKEIYACDLVHKMPYDVYSSPEMQNATIVKLEQEYLCAPGASTIYTSISLIRIHLEHSLFRSTIPIEKTNTHQCLQSVIPTWHSANIISRI